MKKNLQLLRKTTNFNKVLWIFVCVFYMVSMEKAAEIPGGTAVCGNIYAGGFAGGDRAGDQCVALW